MRRVRKARGSKGGAHYSAEQVNFIREAYLLDGQTLGWIGERLHPPCSPSALWRIAIGRAYSAVPLSERLRAAVESEEQARAQSIAQLAATPAREAPHQEEEEDADLLGEAPSSDYESGGVLGEGEDWA